MIHNRHFLGLFFLAAFSLSILGINLHGPDVSAAYTTAQINAKLDTGVARAAGWDTSCRNHLNANRTSSSNLRTIINTGASYADMAWFSERGSPNVTTPTEVPYNATTVPLQVNSVTFLCGSLVNVDKYGTGSEPASSAGAIADENYRWVTSGNANDRNPNAIGSENQRPARVDTTSKITRYQVLSGGGSVTGGEGSQLIINRDNGSRYWFSAPINVNYNDSSGITAARSVDVRVYYRQIAGYHATSGSSRVEVCGTSSANNLNIDSCPEQFDDLRINLAPAAAPSADVNGIKVTDGGNDTRDSAIDGERVTLTDCNGTVMSSAQPFYFNDRPTNCMLTISVPDKPGWTVLGTAFCPNNTDCSAMVSSPTTYGGYGGGSGAFRSGKSRTFGTLATNVAYQFRIVYRKIPPPSSTWTLNPTTTADRTTAAPGDTIYFEHLVNNNSGKTAPGTSWSYTILSSTNTGGQGPAGGQTLSPGQTEAVGANFGFARSYTIPSSATNGSRFCQNVSVSPSEEGTSNVATSNEWCVTVVTAPMMPPPGCFGMPPGANGSYVTVALPDNGPRDAAPSAAAYSPSQTDREQVVADTPNTEVIGITDTSPGGGADVPPTLVNDEPYQSATIDYTPFIQNYPYDPNDATVQYTADYKERTWTSASSPSYYDCRGYTQSGATCSYPATATCPSGGSPSGANCTGSNTSSTSCTTNSATPPVTTCAPCPAPSTGPGGTNGCSTPFSYPIVYTCGSGDTLNGTNCEYSGTARYNYTAGPWSATLTSGSMTADADDMGPCYERNYNLQPVSSESRLTIDAEDPSGVNFIANIAGSLNATNPVNARGDVRNPLRVNGVVIRGEFYVLDQNGARRPYYNNVPVNFGPTDVVAPGLSSTYTLGSTETYFTSAGVSRPPLNYGDRICLKVIMDFTQGTMQVNGNRTASNVYADNDPPTCSQYVSNKPYFKVFKGDIATGGDFTEGGACNGVSGTTGSLKGQYRGDARGNIGAGTELAAYALSGIDGVTSATIRTAIPVLEKGLSFANTTGTFGGNFTSSRCVPDFYGTTQFDDGDNRKRVGPAPSNQLNLNASGPVQAENEFQRVVRDSAPVQIEIKAPQPIDGRKTIYVDGDVYITDNITYTAPSTVRQANLPYLAIIAKGNIYISSGVSQLNGLYVAQPRDDGSKGHILTCTNGFGPMSTFAMESSCRSKLTVYGSFIANRLYLQRTLGTLREGNQFEDVNSSNLAEAFVGSPDAYVGRPLFKTKTGLYDSLRSLPPTL